ncbi:MAG: nicotinate phosphoribosyltransferase [Acidilobaceae archaeon]|nr:nicotinate phosphoribosyltransferase [Acidilobaceae archaeon]
MREPRFYIVSPEEVLRGEATDIYFYRTKILVEKYGYADVEVRMQVHSYSLPKGYEWAVFAGLEEALALLKGRPLNVYAMPEGTVFRRKYPLMLIEGRFSDMALLETAYLGLLRFASSIATKAARIKAKVGNKQVLFFGLRALHPAVYVSADRAAYIGGVDAVSGMLSEKYLGLKPRGTMPHALIVVFGDQRKAWKAFAETFSHETPVIALADTFLDERVESLMAAELLGKELYGVRLDTPGSRRGRMRDIVEEVRWALRRKGYDHVKIVVSGGLDEQEVEELRDVADIFGVGTSIASAPSVDISADIVEVKGEKGWEPRAKRGKIPLALQVYRCSVNEEYLAPFDGSERPSCKDGREAEPLLVKYLDRGELVRPLPSLQEIREYVLRQLAELTQSPRP